ncbi:hypothetical protein ER50_06925 [Bacillus safensis]|nr:hypothetical protein ER50_06925 [Bacillus safensis]
MAEPLASLFEVRDLHMGIKGASLKKFKSEIQGEYLFKGTGSCMEGGTARHDVRDTGIQCGENRTKRLNFMFFQKQCPDFSRPHATVLMKAKRY